MKSLEVGTGVEVTKLNKKDIDGAQTLKRAEE